MQTDGKWVVLAPGNDLRSLSTYSHGTPPTPTTSNVSRSPTGLQLYRLVLPSYSNSVSASPPKLNFVRSLRGHTSPTSAVTLADGKCISLGENCSVWVWDLEAGSGSEVTSDKTCPGAADFSEGAISFDERRIVSAIAGKSLSVPTYQNPNVRLFRLQRRDARSANDGLIKSAESGSGELDVLAIFQPFLRKG